MDLEAGAGPPRKVHYLMSRLFFVVEPVTQGNGMCANVHRLTVLLMLHCITSFPWQPSSWHSIAFQCPRLVFGGCNPDGAFILDLDNHFQCPGSGSDGCNYILLDFVTKPGNFQCSGPGYWKQPQPPAELR